MAAKAAGWGLVCLAASLWAADPARDLLDAASQGRISAVADLIAKGAPLESKDKNGRTALMLASQRGHAPIVKLLLDKGADASARDQAGATAWVLATFSPAGDHGGNGEVLKLLPRPLRPKFSLEANWSGGSLYNSCVMRLDQLTQFIGGMQLDGLALSTLRSYIAAAGRDLIEIAAAGAPADPPAGALLLTVHPGASCVAQQSADRLSLTVDFYLLRAKDKAVLVRKSVGGSGWKALDARMVSGQSQYLPVYQEWLRAAVQQIYLPAVEAWYRAE